MSHYTVLVVGDDHEALLAPYDENLPGERRTEPVEISAEYWPFRELIEKEYITENDLSDADFVFAAFQKYEQEEGDTGEDYDVVGGQFVRWTSYNENSKWDWYSVGGRWNGYFAVKPQSGYLYGKGQAGVMGTVNMDPLRADKLQRGALDVEAMVSEAALKAGQQYDRVSTAIDVHGPIQPFPERVTNIADTDMDAYRATISQWYEDHDWLVTAYTGIGPEDEGGAFRRFDFNVDVVMKMIAQPREEYTEYKGMEALVPYAYLDADGWDEPGRMGWFGMSTETADSREAYVKRVYNKIITLDDNEWMTLIDCHI